MASKKRKTSKARKSPTKAPYRLVVRPETLAEADAKRGYEERPGYLHRMLHIGMGAKEQAANQALAALADVPPWCD